MNLLAFFLWCHQIWLPQERRTQLFSATMTTKVAKLQRACLSDPVKVEVATKYSTVDTLRQQYLFIPAKYKVLFPELLLSINFDAWEAVSSIHVPRNSKRHTPLHPCQAHHATTQAI